MPAAELRPREYRRDHDLHLELRESGAEAAAHAAAERNPGVGLGRAFEESLGTESLRVRRIQLRVVLHEQDRGGQLRSRLEQVAAQLGRLGRRAEDLGHHGSHAQRLLDHRVDVVAALPRLHFGGQALERVRRAQKALERPSDRRRGRFVPREQDRDQLVAQLSIRQRIAVLVAGGQQQGQDVVARVAVGIVATALDLLVEHLVDAVAIADEAAPGAARTEVLSHQLDAEDRVDRGQPRQQALQLGDAVGIGDAEDRSDDHLHRDRLGDGARADRVARAPAVDLAVGDLLDQLGVVRDRLAVKRRQHQLAHAHVTLRVEQQDRRRSGDRLHHLPWLADVVLRRLPLEHLLDQLAVGDVEDLARRSRRWSGRRLP